MLAKQGASTHAEAEDGYEVVATFAPADASADPARLRMRLADGDAVRFALPHRPGTTYTFERSGRTVAVSAEPAALLSAAPES
jgi:hypothetical protein